jgi:hypothetical protein
MVSCQQHHDDPQHLLESWLQTSHSQLPSLPGCCAGPSFCTATTTDTMAGPTAANALLVLSLLFLATASAHPHHRRRLQQVPTDASLATSTTIADPTLQDPAAVAAAAADPAPAQQAAAAQAVPASMPTEPLTETTAPVESQGVPGPPHLDPSAQGLNAHGVYRLVAVSKT